MTPSAIFLLVLIVIVGIALAVASVFERRRTRSNLRSRRSPRRTLPPWAR